MVFPDTELGVVVELLLDGAWTDITDDVRGEQGIVITRGRTSESSQVEPGRCSLTLDNENSKYNWRNPTSPYFGLLGRNTPIRVSVLANSGELYRRFVGEVTAWPPRWTEGGLDVWVPIEAAGLLLRLGANTPPLLDSMRRHIQQNGPVAYWPLTDGEAAQYGTEVAAGGQPLRALGVAGSFYQGQPGWHQGSVASWLTPVAELTQRSVSGTLTTSVSATDVSGWSFDHVRSGSGRREDLYLTDAGDGTNEESSIRWQVGCDVADDAIEVWTNVLTDAGEAETLEATVTKPGIFDQAPHHIRLSVADNGAGGTSWALYVDSLLAASGTVTTPTLPIRSITYLWAEEDTSASSDSVALGHLTYWGEDPPHVADTYQALLGHDRELAGRRIERLCAEESVELRVHGDLDQTQAMGPQTAGSVLDLLRHAEEVDAGVLGESREELALAYRTGRSRYNQGVS